MSMSRADGDGDGDRLACKWAECYLLSAVELYHYRYLVSTGTYLTLQYLGLNGKRRHDFTATTYHYPYPYPSRRQWNEHT